jgi:hypothetical protein
VWRQIDPLTDPRWSALVAHHPRASVFHTKAWLDALQRTYGYTPIAYTTSPPGESLENAVLFCRVESWLTGRRLVSLPFSDHCDPLVSDDEGLATFIPCLAHIAAEERARYIEFRPLRPPNGIADLESHQTYWFHQIDLRPPLEVLLENLHKDSIQRKVCRAQREGLTCKTGNSDSLVNDFWRLFLVTRRRHLTPPPPKRWFCNVLSSFGRDAALRVAFHGQEPVAAVITLRCNKTMVYKYGCSDASWHHLGGMPFLLWTSIQTAKQEGLAVFDLGRSDCDATGLITFKDRWGSSRSRLTYYRSPALASEGFSGLRDSNRIEWLKGTLISRLPDALFSSAGSLLYKHLG